jgi:hypothetical protein
MSMSCHRCLASFALTLVLFLVLFHVLSCSQETPSDRNNKQPPPSIQYDQELAKISTHAAVMQLSSAVGKLTQCSISESLSKIPAQNKGEAPLANKILDDMKINATIQCELFSRAERETKRTFEKIKAGNQLLEQQYFFSIFTPSDSTDAGTFDENTIGLFLTIDQCRSIEQEAFDQGIPVRKCGLFTN